MAYLAAKSATITINSIPYKFQSFKYQESASEFDATNIAGSSNSAGLLSEEIGVDMISTSWNGTFVVDGAAIQTLKTGRLYPLSFTGADGDVHTGNTYVLQRSKPAASKGAFIVDCSGKMTGVVAGQ